MGALFSKPSVNLTAPPPPDVPPAANPPTMASGDVQGAGRSKRAASTIRAGFAGTDITGGAAATSSSATPQLLGT